MPIENQVKVAKDALIPAALRVRKKLPSDPDNWNDYDVENIRATLPVEFHSVPVADLRNQCGSLRKNGDLGTVTKSGHARAKRPQPPEWYKAYIKSDKWKRFRATILAFWGHRCALCYSDHKLEVHHRTYERVVLDGDECKELQTDCIALCRDCHAAADRARARAAKNAAALAAMGS